MVLLIADFAESEEEIKQLKEKLNKTEQEIDEKDKVIEILEAGESYMGHTEDRILRLEY